MKRIVGNTKGMTLVEIMVVIAIIGLVGAITTGFVIDRLEDARVDSAKAQIKGLESMLDQFRRDAGFYPASEQGLSALVEQPSIGRTPRRYPPRGYTNGKPIPKDPWGCDYIYYSPGVQGHPYEVYSLGADCQEGGSDYDADIASFEIGQ